MTAWTAGRKFHLCILAKLRCSVISVTELSNSAASTEDGFKTIDYKFCSLSMKHLKLWFLKTFPNKGFRPFKSIANSTDVVFILKAVTLLSCLCGSYSAHIKKPYQAENKGASHSDPP